MDFLGILKIKALNNSSIIFSGKTQKSLEFSAHSTTSLPIFNSEVIKIGRGKNCDIRIENPSVSLHHATIWSIQFDPTTSPIVYINDNSRNGTVCNTENMFKGETRILTDGDHLEIKTAAFISFEAIPLVFISSPHEQIVTKLKDWQITNTKIGSGSFGSVYVAKFTKRKSPPFAVKIIPKRQTGKFEYDDIHFREVHLLSKASHPNIIKVYEAIADENSIYIFQDLICGGDLFSYLVHENYLRAIPEKETIFIVFQLMKALQFLHKSLHIVHRDLKLDNILMQLPLPKSKIFICDFGIAKLMTQTRTNTCVGTIEYSAPEVFKCDLRGKAVTPYSFKCDAWSLGIITHILLSGISPFYSQSKESILRASREGILNFNKKQFLKVSKPAKGFISALLKVNASDRLDIDGCFEHEWIKNNRPKLESFYREKISH
ncbi:hypothetical protein KGF56_003742 [Candida oxycetoniae]|uniref:Meiosis-specific serine/threonine-protein kinase MEK1 n=1 Tax=Candida oxycetoniae TaxID=497107 RepID=A0AAI9WWX1_9ASCO|nr:uncharacterized protein KGF56_003742 [Candida oxycetoniae]KAI3403458.2 hypothetical protein KGF56_003742 [Candida oxycetoniae]